MNHEQKQMLTQPYYTQLHFLTYVMHQANEYNSVGKR